MAANLALSTEHRRSLMAAIVCTSAVGTTMGMMWPLLALILDRQGVDSALIGLSSATQSLATLVVSPFASLLIMRAGMVRCAGGCILLILITIALLPIFETVQAWFAIRFALGAGTVVLFICTQIWVSQIAPELIRGRIVGIFGFLWSAGFAAGPLVIQVTGIEGWAPFAAAILLVAMAGLPLLLAPQISDGSGRVYFRREMLAMLRLGGAAVSASLVQGLLDSITDSFLPIYGLLNGLDQASSVTLLVVLQAGVLAVQLPIGWAADRVNRRVLLVGLTALSLLMNLLMPLAAGQTLMLWPCLFLLGVASGGIWTVSLVLTGELFQGTRVAAALALKSILYGIGSIAGPPAVGIAIATAGPITFPLLLAAVCAVFMLLQFGPGPRHRND